MSNKTVAAEGSLEFFCGALRSGKTSFAFERGLEHMLVGGTVVTNIEPYREVIRTWMHEDHGLEFDDSRLIQVEDGTDMWKSAVKGTDNLATMLLVDEAHVEHNARDYQKTVAEQLMFNTMVGKLGVKVVYITQDLNNVDKQFRRMAQRITYCRNLKQFKLFGFLPFPFNLFVRVPYVCGPGVQPMKQSPEVTFRPLSWGMFNSHALVGRAERTFADLAVANTKPLRRIPKPVKPMDWDKWAAIAASTWATLI